MLITAGTSWFLGNYRFLGRFLQEPWLLLPRNLQERLQEKHTGVRAVPVLHVGYCRNFLVPGELLWFWATGRNGVPAGNNNLVSLSLEINIYNTISLRRHATCDDNDRRPPPIPNEGLYNKQQNNKPCHDLHPIATLFYPEAEEVDETMTCKRVVRIIIYATLAFSGVTYYHSSSLLDQYHCDNITCPTDNITRSSASKSRIFYNLFIRSVEDEDRVRSIVEEQFQHLNPLLHDTNVSIISIGHPLSSMPYNLSISVHYNQGSELLTLHTLWEYCKSNNNPSTKVIYLHSKGSFHPTRQNELLRNFLTLGALSEECANLPDSCNVCSSRMSPLPHPHTSGNMWLARCDYVAQLFNPFMTYDHILFRRDNGCKGWGRYLAEHWVHSHPSVKPCDLYPGKEFTWYYHGIPQGAQLELRELKLAPRFQFEDYVKRKICDHESRVENFVSERMANYELLYNITEVDVDWWGWEFVHRSFQ